MPRRESAPIGAPCWVDLLTSDLERSRAFSGVLFGWTAESPNEEFGAAEASDPTGARFKLVAGL